jgi:hypothetical protein
MPSLSARCAATCDCVIILLLAALKACEKGDGAQDLFQAVTGKKSDFFLEIMQVSAQHPLIPSLRQRLSGLRKCQHRFRNGFRTLAEAPARLYDSTAQ